MRKINPITPIGTTLLTIITFVTSPVHKTNAQNLLQLLACLMVSYLAVCFIEISVDGCRKEIRRQKRMRQPRRFATYKVG